MGKFLNIIFIIAGIAAVIAAIDYFSPVKISGTLYSVLFKGGGCSQIVTIENKEMEPRLRQGSTVIFNTCVTDKTRIPMGSVVLVEPFLEEKRIGILKNRMPKGNNVYYGIATEKNPFEIDEVNSSDVKGVYEPPSESE